MFPGGAQMMTGLGHDHKPTATVRLPVANYYELTHYDHILLTVFLMKALKVPYALHSTVAVKSLVTFEYLGHET